MPEIKYFLGYMAKINGFIDPEEYVFDENKQYIFESILYTAITLYYNGGASKSKLIEKHNQFVQEIENKNEERLGRTAQLNTIALQALKELGYTDFNNANATEIYEKIAEIEMRKI